MYEQIAKDIKETAGSVSGVMRSSKADERKCPIR